MRDERLRKSLKILDGISYVICTSGYVAKLNTPDIDPDTFKKTKWL